MKRQTYFAALCLGLAVSGCQSPATQIESHDGYQLVVQRKGPSLGIASDSTLTLLHQDGCVFKDLNHNDSLDAYEDWRLTPQQRAHDLAQQLSISEIAGLMLYSSMESIPSTAWNASTYHGKPYAESGAQPWELTDRQLQFLADGIRHILITTVESPEVAARWNNQLQAAAEASAHGIPFNNSSDPRHSARADSEFNAGGGGEISMWPSSLGMAATFSPELMQRFGEVIATEYRALGITTALSPQVDLATEPRWFRFSGTMGEDPALATDLARAYCDGIQTSTGADEIRDGWGLKSVNAMTKHWPGGGACEGGRDAHYGFGKYSVFPNNNLPLARNVFIDGAFHLDGPTCQTAAVMPYYTISYRQGKEAVGNSFDRGIITDQLRTEAHFDGVVCTDWAITDDVKHPGIHGGKPWGVETLTKAQRHYKAILAGVDQFGGNMEVEPVLEAYRLGVAELGEKAMDARMRKSAERLLLNMFRVGLFENPYTDPTYASEVVGNAELMAEGYDAQVKSTVMLKNHAGTLPIQAPQKVYIPQRTIPASVNFWGAQIPEQIVTPLPREIVERYYTPVDTPEDADFAIVFIESPNSGYGYSLDDLARGGNGYLPISLQYSDYTATDARAVSLAGRDPMEASANRSYRGKTTHTVNAEDMDLVVRTKQQMGDRPVIVSINILNPCVLSEIEPYADALFLTFDVQNQVVLDLVSGQCEPSALLPMQMPADMHTVEAQAEDTPRDMTCYRDADGHTYDFAFGLNWKGVIRDKRTERYK
jgi:beta-glucosidase